MSMRTKNKIVALFPLRSEPLELRQRHAAALRQCIAAIAEEASDGGFVLTGQALELAIAVLLSEQNRALPAEPASSSRESAE